MTDAWWNMFCYLQQENAVLKAKYNDLHKLVGEILETVKLDAKLRVDKDKEKKLKFRCKYQNKGFCREGSSCEYSHREENCQEYCSSGSCSQDPICQYRHPNKCKFWIRGKCWRGSSCVYLHKSEDLGCVESNDDLEKNDDDNLEKANDVENEN